MWDFSKLVEWVKLPTTAIFALCLASGTMLFAGDSILRQIGLGTYPTQRDLIAGLVFLVTLSLLIARIGSTVATSVKGWLKVRRMAKYQMRRLSNLSAAERTIFAQYIREDTRTLEFDMSNGVVQNLVHEGFLFRPSKLSKYHTIWDHNLYPWLWDYLHEHPEVYADRVETK